MTQCVPRPTRSSVALTLGIALEYDHARLLVTVVPKVNEVGPHALVLWRLVGTDIAAEVVAHHRVGLAGVQGRGVAIGSGRGGEEVDLGGCEGCRKEEERRPHVYVWEGGGCGRGDGELRCW